MGRIKFTKMHGAGNDYIYVNVMQYPIADPVKAAVLWSDRHKGIGSDGLVLIGASPIPEADFSMRIFNADGSEAMMCGNASRCIGKYLYERGLTTQTQIKLLSNSGIKTLNLHVRNGVVESVTVDMGEPQFENEEQFIPSRGIAQGTFVSMGNPHYVIFTDNVDQVGETGRILEYHPAFPQRCNIEFATPLSSPKGDTMAPSNRTIEVPSGTVEGGLRTRVWTMYYGEGPTPVEEIKGRAGWDALKAVQNDDILNADSNEISRPGPRLVDAAETLYTFVSDDAQEPAA